ncbi:MAG: sensor histidine kinase [Chloroflexi bacterium]|nr:sensor histidine kinase [Chloroflexota bacterium]
MESHPLSAQEEHLAARRILAITEEELQRIILDVHDGPVQRLFAARSQLSALQNRRAHGESIAEADYDKVMGRVAQLLDGALAEIRAFLGTFRPPDFARRDFIEIIRDLLIYHEETTGCQVYFAGPDCLQTPLSLPVKIALYRICQEALSNAYRHSGANEQWVQIDETAVSITLSIWDEGRGFSPPPLTGPAATEREEHIGLRGMRDRVALVGGAFELDSSPQRGTRITVRAPIYE